MKFWYNGHPIETLGQRYHLEGHLGSGGMAEVWLAWDEREQREVALKVLKAEDLDQETLNRFLKEASQIASWQHAHILRIYEPLQIELLDPAHASGLFYSVMEYASGGDLHKRLTPGTPFPLAASFALFHQLCDAVQYAHEHGIIHRDLKPLNILFRRPSTGPEEVVLSDFGLAVHVNASHFTFARGGTLAYMAPEQFEGRISPANDIFALGVILYQLCTGRLPFRRTIQNLPPQQNIPQPTRPSLLNPDLPPDLDDLILHALRAQPLERYESAREFWNTIEHTLILLAPTYPDLSEAFWQATGKTWPVASSQKSVLHTRTAEQQNSRTAEQQNSRTAEQQNSRTAGPPISGSARAATPGQRMRLLKRFPLYLFLFIVYLHHQILPLLWPMSREKRCTLPTLALSRFSRPAILSVSRRCDHWRRTRNVRHTEANACSCS